MDVPLAEALSVLRQELLDVVDAARGSDLRFEVGDIELALDIAVTREASGRAGIKFWLVDAGVGGKAASTRTHRVTLTLKPVDGTGATVLLADDDEREPG